jgi:hypothetical protein
MNGVALVVRYINGRDRRYDEARRGITRAEHPLRRLRLSDSRESGAR